MPEAVAALWAWLSANKETVGIVLSAVGLVGAGCWKLFEYFSNRGLKPSSFQVSNDAGGQVILSLDEYERRLKKREQEVRAEAERANVEGQALLETELKAAQEKLANIEEAYEQTKERLTEASQVLPSVAVQASPGEIEQAQQALRRGDTAKAEMLFERAAETGEKQAAIAHLQIGRLAEDRIQYTTALDHYRKAAQLAPEDPHCVSAYGGMLNKMGRLQESEVVYRQALSDLERKGDTNSSKAAVYLNNLALSMYDQAKYAEAEKLFYRALNILLQKDQNPRDVTTTLGNLAMVYKAQGRFAEAEEVFQRALARSEANTALFHDPGTTTLLSNLGDLYVAQGRFSEAERVNIRVLQIQQSLHPADHPLVAKALNNLAVVYEKQARFSEAKPLYERALVIREKAFGPEHTEVATNLDNLAMVYFGVRDYPRAEELCRRALAMFEKLLGPDHPDAATAANTLGLILKYQGQYEEAEQLYRRALEIDQKVLGPDHLHVASTLRNLALLYEDQGKLEEAARLFTRVLHIREKAFGPEHSKVNETISSLADLYAEIGDYAAAEPLYRRALAIIEAKDGTGYPNFRTGAQRFAAMLAKAGKADEAKAILARIPEDAAAAAQ